MPLYTFFLEFKEGTYVSQVRSDTYEKAPEVWARQLDVKAIKGLKPKGKQLLIDEMQEDEPVLLMGLINTWCSVARVNDALALIHFTETVE